MALTFVIIFLCAAVVFACILALGWEAASARQYLTQAVVLAEERKFDEALQATLVAVRQNPSFKSNPDVQALYEIIVARAAGDSVSEIERIKLAIPQLPKTKWEKMVGDTRMRIVVIAVIVVEILLKVAAHY